MPLAPGSRLGVYEVTALIGAGGMGEVYRATDSNLKRSVAIKVLPAGLAGEADRLARFQREAEALAALNHPQIASIYGLEKTSDCIALVMELVEGEDLSQRIAHGAILIEEALGIAKQIAEALEAAHEHGIIHRDLKPANIKVRDDGTVKVLDFGLAKMLAPEGSSVDVSQSPTITTPGVTGRGVILGTAPYMSPEQARGKPADKRSDVWAFGAVVYEMLAGTRAFQGTETTDVLAAVVRDEPEWSRLPAGTPPAVRRMLRRALKKDRRQRLADIADARFDVEEAIAGGHGDVAPSHSGLSRRERAFWAATALALLIAASIGFGRRPAPPTDAPIARFDVPLPPTSTVDWSQPISPDGKLIALVARTEGKPQLWLRPVDSTSMRPLPGTEGATRPFWSPDSLHIGFLVDGDLKEVGIDGSAPRLIARGPFRDGAWGANGVMLAGGQRGRPLMRVADVGGEAVAETALDESRHEISHDYPEFLPDGQHYVFLARLSTRAEDFASYIGTLGTKERRPLAGIRAAVKYSPTGHLLFLRDANLMAQAFDPDRLELAGEPFLVSEQAAGGRTAAFSVSRNGSLAFIGGSAAVSQLTWFDRSGERLASIGPSNVYESTQLSADGRVVAFDRGTPRDIWLLDVQRGTVNRVIADRTDDRQPLVSPDGASIAFVSTRGDADGIYERTLGSADDRLLIRHDLPITLHDWSANGNYLLYSTDGDLWALPLSGDRKPLQLTSSPRIAETAAKFSPDGKWFALQSDEAAEVSRSGQGDIYLQSFPPRGVATQVSTGGGFAPRWNAASNELYYVAPDEMIMAATIESRGTTVDVTTPKPLFRARFGQVPLGVRARYDVARDGRFLIREGRSDIAIHVILNWAQQLRRAAR
ncbi:MAG TPA: protein kinase [Vicinamibacterales bacterium]